MITSTEYLCTASAGLSLTLEHRSEGDDECWIVGLSSWDHFRQYFKEGPARALYAQLAEEHDMREQWEWEHAHVLDADEQWERETNL